MTNYTTRLIWERSPEMERALAQSKASALLRQIEEMEFCKRPRSVIWRAAVHARAYAMIAQDRVLAMNAAEIIDRVRSPKRYSAAERRAIHDKALAMVASWTPSSPSSHKKRYIKTDAKFRKLGALIDKLRMRTTARGCTAQEEKTARDVVFDMLRGNRCRDTGLSPAELEQFRLWYSRGRALI